MNQPEPEIVRIGVAGAQVKSVTGQRVDYLDEAGQVSFVDLEQCVRNWVGYHDKHGGDFLLMPGATAESAAEWNSRCVGQRNLGDDPPWVEFMNERRTRFEFEDSDKAYRQLLDPLSLAGLGTFDMD